MDVNLVVFKDDKTRRVFPLSRGVTTIGRKMDCDIRIPVPEVSRRHAELMLDDDGVVLRDLGAANGTFLNNRRITEEELEPGDQVMVGPVVFTVQIDGEPDEEEMVTIASRRRAQASAGAGAQVRASHHVSTSDDEVDPIAALEALASSADQTAINPDDPEEKP